MRSKASFQKLRLQENLRRKKSDFTACINFFMQRRQGQEVWKLGTAKRFFSVEHIVMMHVE